MLPSVRQYTKIEKCAIYSQIHNLNHSWSVHHKSDNLQGFYLGKKSKTFNMFLLIVVYPLNNLRSFYFIFPIRTHFMVKWSLFTILLNISTFSHLFFHPLWKLKLWFFTMQLWCAWHLSCCVNPFIPIFIHPSYSSCISSFLEIST